MNPRYLGLIGKIDWSIDNISQLQGRFGAVENAFQHKILPLFDHYTSVGNVGADETDLYSDTIAGGTLAADGDRLELVYAGTTVNSPTAKRPKIYFGGTEIFHHEALHDENTFWEIRGTIIRSSSSSIRYTLSIHSRYALDGNTEIAGELTGLTLNSDNILKLTGQTDNPVNNEIVAILSTITWISHA